MSKQARDLWPCHVALANPPNDTESGVYLQLSDGYVQRYKKQPRVQVDMQVKQTRRESVKDSHPAGEIPSKPPSGIRDARKESVKDSHLTGGRAPPIAGPASGSSTLGRKKLSAGGVAGSAGAAGEAAVAKPDFNDEK
jgi:hypothetical protein